jgi:hypothetical protein
MALLTIHGHGRQRRRPIVQRDADAHDAFRRPTARSARSLPAGLRVGAAMFTAEAVATLAGAVAGPAAAQAHSMTWTAIGSGIVTGLSAALAIALLPRQRPQPGRRPDGDTVDAAVVAALRRPRRLRKRRRSGLR